MTAPGTQGEVSPESMGKNSIFSRREPAKPETGLSPHYWEHCGTKSAETLPRKAVRSMERVDVRKSKREFAFRDSPRCRILSLHAALRARNVRVMRPMISWLPP